MPLSRNPAYSSAVKKDRSLVGPLDGFFLFDRCFVSFSPDQPPTLQNTEADFFSRDEPRGHLKHWMSDFHARTSRQQIVNSQSQRILGFQY